MIFGLDYLGGAKYQKAILEAHPAGFAAGFFSNTFGDALPTVDKLLRTGRCPLVRLHPMWKDRHDFTRKDVPAIMKEVQRYRRLIAKYPSVHFQVSTGCESAMGRMERKSLYMEVQRTLGFSKAMVLDCPMPGSEPIHGIGVFSEIHGARTPSPGAAIHNFSFDGDSAVDSNVDLVRQNHNDCMVFFLWEPRFNGRWESNDLTPREKRKGWPNANFIRSVAALAQPKGFTKLPRNWLYKSHSENKGKGDRRAEMPVMIAPVKIDKIVLKLGDRVVHELKYYGRYEDGRHRYYASKYGFQIADGACGVYVKNRSVGLINPAFREGAFR